jgi:hypothetical protein
MFNFRRVFQPLNNRHIVRRYATMSGGGSGRRPWTKAEWISILVPFAVLAPFLMYDKPFTTKWWQDNHTAHADEKIKEKL